MAAPLKLKPAASKEAAAATVAATAKDEFVTKTGRAPRQLPTPRMKVVRLDEEDATGVKIMVYGPWGSGKTFAIVGLLELGFKVLVINTDIGGNGLMTIKTEMRNRGKAELLKNVYAITLESYEDVDSFIENPMLYMPEIYDVGLDFLFWDGFSGFQQIGVSEYVGNITPERASGKEVSEARASGLQMEQADWGMIRNATVRKLSRFCGMNNKKTGQVWHKVVTCLEGIKAKGGGQGGFNETKQPLLQGAGGVLAGAAFDLIFETQVKTEKGEDGEERKYYYVTAGHQNLAAKSRGIKLEPVEPADFAAIWGKIAAQAGVTAGATVAGLIEEVPAPEAEA